MADRSSIEWCDATWNPVTGCTPVSAGCENCYAKRMTQRFRNLHQEGIPHDSRDQAYVIDGTIPFSKIMFHPNRLDQPLHWKKPRRIFVCSMGDLFHEEVKDVWIDMVFDIIKGAERHDFLILTKRPDRMHDYLFHDVHYSRKDIEPIHNLWLGVTVENQEMADQRIPILLQTPAAVRFVSVEPMLGPVSLQRWTPISSCAPAAPGVGIGWVICGGETGPKARSMEYGWAFSLKQQCLQASIPFFFKGWGTHHIKKSDTEYMLISGCEWKQFPEVKE